MISLTAEKCAELKQWVKENPSPTVFMPTTDEGKKHLVLFPKDTSKPGYVVYAFEIQVSE